MDREAGRENGSNQVDFPNRHKFKIASKDLGQEAAEREIPADLAAPIYRYQTVRGLKRACVGNGEIEKQNLLFTVSKDKTDRYGVRHKS